MISESWTAPDANEHGFVPFDKLRKHAAGCSLEQFVSAYPVPALLTVLSGNDPTTNSDVLDPNDAGVQLLTVTVPAHGILRYLGKAAFVAKRPGNPFAHLISVGRSKTNDITVAVDSVSKVHGYFVFENGAWRFTDHGSTNGSKLGGEPLTAGEKYPLFDGAVLQLGLEVTLEFLTPEGLYRRTAEPY